MFDRFRSTGLAALVVVMVAFSITPALAADDGSNFTQYNIWYESPEKVFSTNYQRGAMIPAGTEVRDVFVKSKGRNKYVEFTLADSDLRVRVYWVKKHDPANSIEKLADRLIGERNFEKLVEGFSEKEVAAIKSGEVVRGMCKDAVLVAQGYPPSRATPSLESHEWRYWQSRFDSILISFEGGVVASILD